jgi:UDP-2-acetamido-2,6-beta-L-arabino-hexul-4-ose reductase
MRIVVTGGDGFIGRNLRVRLHELGHVDVRSVGRNTSAEELRAAVASADFVYHLAGVNRPKEISEFDRGNRALTETVCDALRATGRAVPVAYTSSTQAALENPYGASKRAAEAVVQRYAAETGATAHVLRLTNVFGKWCRPNYNSAVATFCHNVAHGLPITVNDPAAPLRLVYIDDVVDALIGLLHAPDVAHDAIDIEPTWTSTVGEVAAAIREFAASRDTRVTPRVGLGFTRALYATYLSYLPADAFTYSLTPHVDARGVFAEMLKTPDCGQFSFFTAHPGVTRGGHYHHTKSEKFLVVQGRARFGFRQIVTGEVHEVVVSGQDARVVETVPGWAHDVTNVGDNELVVMLWANERFDPGKPDTVTAPVTG